MEKNVCYKFTWDTNFDIFPTIVKMEENKDKRRMETYYKLSV